MSDVGTKVRFPADAPVYKLLRSRVRAAMAGRARTAGALGGLNVALIVTLIAACYVSLLCWVDAAWQAVLIALLLVQGLVLMGTNIMHESVHDAVSRHRWVNRVLARSLEVLGGNQSLWRFKHTVVHHTYTSIVGVDDDIDTGGLLRLHPDQPWRSYHRLQALYFPALYSLSALGWFFADFVQYRTMRVGTARIPDFTPGEHALFWGGKALWIVLVLALPMMFHPPWLVIATALAIYLVFGFNIALIFQLAHVVEDASWVRPAEDGTVDHEWAVHQLKTTVNFGTANGLWNWYTGGLSYQIEHHLFPRISHVHYPAISRVVKQTCAELGLPYHEHRHTRSVVVAHVRHLAAMGRRP